MKKKIIIILAIFLLVFLLTRPDKIIKGLFLYSNFLITEIPSAYQIKDADKNSFIYANDYKTFYPILFFRNDSIDYVLFKLNCNANNVKVENIPFESTINTISSSYKFTYGDLDFYLDSATKKNSNITINGNEIKYSNSPDNQIFETDNDFEVFQNGKRIFCYQGKSHVKKFIVVKKENIALFYIIETNKLTKEDIVDKFLK